MCKGVKSLLWNVLMDSDRDLSEQETKEELGSFLTRRCQEVPGELPLLPTAQGDRENLKSPTEKFNQTLFIELSHM